MTTYGSVTVLWHPLSCRSSRTTVSEAMVLVDVPVDTMSADDPIDMDAPIETSPTNALADIIGDNYCRAATQWENAITGVDQIFCSFAEFREASLVSFFVMLLLYAHQISNKIL